MPFEDDITRMRAELLNRFGPAERPEVYDDGQSMLSQNPYMQEVGLFKAPKFNPARRTMGLDLPSAKPQTPVPTAIENPSTAIVPAQPVQKTSPLEALANMPMTRRKALEIPMNAAISNVGRGLIGKAVAPVVESAITNVAPKVAESTFVRNPLFDEYLQDYASRYLSHISENEPYQASIWGYQLLRDYLQDKIPDKKLEEYDELFERANDYQDENGELIDDAIDAQNELEKIIDDNLKKLKPDELQDFTDQLQQYESTPEDFADEVLRNVLNSGEENFNPKKHYKDLVKYLEDAWSQK